MREGEFRDALFICAVPPVGATIVSAFVGFSWGQYVLAYVITILFVLVWTLILVARQSRVLEGEEE